RPGQGGVWRCATSTAGMLTSLATGSGKHRLLLGRRRARRSLSSVRSPASGPEAAQLWHARACPYEAARALAASDDEPAVREALARFEQLGARRWPRWSPDGYATVARAVFRVAHGRRPELTRPGSP